MIKEKPEFISEFEVSKLVFGEFLRDKGDTSELEESITETGIINPIACSENADGTYEVIAGARRVQKALEMGLKTVPVNIYKTLAKDDKIEMTINENKGRLKPRWQEESVLYVALANCFAEEDVVQIELNGDLKKLRSIVKAMKDAGKLIGKNAEDTLRHYIKLQAAVKVIPELAKEDRQDIALKKYVIYKESTVEEKIAIQEQKLSLDKVVEKKEFEKQNKKMADEAREAVEEELKKEEEFKKNPELVLPQDIIAPEMPEVDDEIANGLMKMKKKSLVEGAIEDSVVDEDSEIAAGIEKASKGTKKVMLEILNQILVCSEKEKDIFLNALKIMFEEKKVWMVKDVEELVEACASCEVFGNQEEGDCKNCKKESPRYKALCDMWVESKK